MIKNIIAPVQAWLLSQKRCVGCGKSLLEAKHKRIKNKDLLICKCGRIYIKEGQIFRRARLEET